MARQLAELHAATASTETEVGWLPLHLLCQGCLVKGELLSSCSLELVRCVRAAHPAAAGTVGDGS